MLCAAPCSRAGEPGKVKAGIDKFKKLVSNLTPEQIEQGKKSLKALTGGRSGGQADADKEKAAKSAEEAKPAAKPVSPAETASAKKKLDELGIPLYKGLTLDSMTEGPKQYDLKYSMPANDGKSVESMKAFYKTELSKKLPKKGWKRDAGGTDAAWTYSSAKATLQIELTPPSGTADRQGIYFGHKKK